MNEGRSGSDAAQDFVSIAVEISIAGEKVRFQINVPPEDAKWEHLLPFMRGLIQVGSEISQEHFAGQGQTVSCRAGCGICCRQMVPLAEFEAHRLRRIVDAMPEPRRSTIIERFQNAEEKMRAAGTGVSIEESQSMEEMVARSGNYFRLMIPCPFLEDESCSIYDERPLKCREYLVTSPAIHCAEPEGGAVTGLPLPLRVFMTALHLGRSAETPEIRWVPLTQLMSWTDQHQENDPGRTGPELLHDFMSRLKQPAATPKSSGS